MCSVFMCGLLCGHLGPQKSFDCLAFLIGNLWIFGDFLQEGLHSFDFPSCFALCVSHCACVECPGGAARSQHTESIQICRESWPPGP